MAKQNRTDTGNKRTPPATAGQTPARAPGTSALLPAEGVYWPRWKPLPDKVKVDEARSTERAFFILPT